MGKMREAFKRWIMIQPSHKTERLVAFEAGYQAAIADVKAGGIVAYKDQNYGNLHHQNYGDLTCTPLYKLPEDE